MDLITAAKTNNIERVRLLLEQGADKDMGDGEGKTALLWASNIGYLEITQYLVEQGAALDKSDNGGWTPLIAATA